MCTAVYKSCVCVLVVYRKSLLSKEGKSPSKAGKSLLLNDEKNSSSLVVVDDVVGVVFFGEDKDSDDDWSVGFFFLGEEGFFFDLEGFFLGEGDTGDGDTGAVLDVLERSRLLVGFLEEEDFFFFGVFGVVGGEL